jgi:hypothetical protein
VAFEVEVTETPKTVRARARTYIWHSLDVTLVGSIQHQWKYGHTNVKPE